MATRLGPGRRQRPSPLAKAAPHYSGASANCGSAYLWPPLNTLIASKFFSERTLGVLLREAGGAEIRFLRAGRVPALAKSDDREGD